MEKCPQTVKQNTCMKTAGRVLSFTRLAANEVAF